MSPLIAGNYQAFPDEVLPVPAGIYTCRSTKIPVIEPTKDGLKEKVVIELKVDGPENPGAHDRLLWDHIGLAAQTRLKRVFLSAKLPIGSDGLNTDDLLDAVVKVRVKARSYKDDGGNVKETSGVDDYLVEA